MALPQRKAAGMHDPWRRYPRYSPECVEGLFCELRVYGFLRSVALRCREGRPRDACAPRETETVGAGK